MAPMRARVLGLAMAALSDIVSICIFREPPQLTLVDGVCQTAFPTP